MAKMASVQPDFMNCKKAETIANRTTSIWSLLRGLGGLGSISKEKLKNHQISDPLTTSDH